MTTRTSLCSLYPERKFGPEPFTLISKATIA